MKLLEIAEKIGATRVNCSEADSIEISGVAPINVAKQDQITFLTSNRYRHQLESCEAAAIIVGKEIPNFKLPQLIHANPYSAMAVAASLFFTLKHTFSGRSDAAFIHPSATVAPSTTIYQNVYIDKQAIVGKNCVLYPGVYIGEKVRIGDDCILFPNAVVLYDCEIGNKCQIQPGAVVGSDGFGFAPTRDGIEKIPQTGRVKIGNNVELGATTTVARGAFEDTEIAEGCKLDAQVLIGHGVSVGEYSMISGQCAIAGSTKIGKRLTTAGHCGIANGLTLGDNITMGAKTGMAESTDVPGIYFGMPAQHGRAWHRQAVAIKSLPSLLRTVAKLEERVRELEAQLTKESP